MKGIGITVRNVDISVGAHWSWEWKVLGEFDFQIGPKLEIFRESKIAEMTVGLLLGFLWLEVDWA